METKITLWVYIELRSFFSMTHMRYTIRRKRKIIVITDIESKSKNGVPELVD